MDIRYSLMQLISRPAHSDRHGSGPRFLVSEVPPEDLLHDAQTVFITEALKCGTTGYVPLQCCWHGLITATKKAMQGCTYISDAYAQPQRWHATKGFND